MLNYKTQSFMHLLHHIKVNIQIFSYTEKRYKSDIFIYLLKCVPPNYINTEKLKICISLVGIYEGSLTMKSMANKSNSLTKFIT